MGNNLESENNWVVVTCKRTNERNLGDVFGEHSELNVLATFVTL